MVFCPLIKFFVCRCFQEIIYLSLHVSTLIKSVHLSTTSIYLFCIFFFSIRLFNHLFSIILLSLKLLFLLCILKLLFILHLLCFLNLLFLHNNLLHYCLLLLWRQLVKSILHILFLLSLLFISKVMKLLLQPIL